MYNNYSYNPYYQQRYNMQPQMMQQPVQIEQQPFNTVQQRSTALNSLNGKVVESVDVVKAMDIPLDGSVSYFPIADGSAIVTKQLQMDGTSKTVVYKPPIEEEKEQPKYLVADDLKELKNDINDLKQEIKDLRKAKKKDE